MGWAVPQAYVGVWSYPPGAGEAVWVDSPAQAGAAAGPRWSWLLPLGLIVVGGALLVAAAVKRAA